MTGLFLNFIIAIIGGFVMNFMPCVLPFISLKISSFIKNSDCKRKFILHNLTYSSGIVVFFLVLSSILLILQRHSHSIVIGSHMQSSLFLLITFFVLLLVGLNLSGLFEFSLPINFNKINNLASKNNWFLKSFISGFFVSFFAISCTAPFIITALTYGLSNPQYLYIIMFGMSIGFAMPFLLAIFYFGKISSLLPKSGEWMVKLQKLLALPIFGCLLWILFILIRKNEYLYSGIALSFGFGVTSYLLIKNLFEELFERKKLLHLILVSSIFALSYFCVPSLKVEEQMFSYKNFNSAMEMGKKVFVVASASWCVTCHLNEFNVLNRTDFKTHLARQNITYFYLDLTHSNQDGSKFLSNYKHNGVPLYILFDSKGHHEILPQILTKQLVLNKISSLT